MVMEEFGCGWMGKFGGKNLEEIIFSLRVLALQRFERYFEVSF